MVDTETTVKRLEHWLLGSGHKEDGTWSWKAVKLEMKNGISPQYQEVRSFIIKEGETQPLELAERVVNEAEAVTEGMGGGTLHFMVRGYMDGERSAKASRPFSVTLEQTEAAEAAEASAQGILGTVMRQNQQLHASVLQMTQTVATSLPRIMQSMGEQIQAMQQVQIDNLRLLRAVTEDHDRRQAEAMATAQKAKDWSELKQVLIPAALEHIGPVVAQLLERVTTPPVEAAQVTRETQPTPPTSPAAQVPPANETDYTAIYLPSTALPTPKS